MDTRGEKKMMGSEEVIIREDIDFAAYREAWDSGYLEKAVFLIAELLVKKPSSANAVAYIKGMTHLNRLHEVFQWFRTEWVAGGLEKWVERFGVQPLFDARMTGVKLLQTHANWAKQTSKGIPPQANPEISLLLETIGERNLSIIMMLLAFFQKEYGLALLWMASFDEESNGLFPSFVLQVSAEISFEMGDREKGRSQVIQSIQNGYGIPFPYLTAASYGVTSIHHYVSSSYLSRSQYAVKLTNDTYKMVKETAALIDWSAVFSHPMALDVAVVVDGEDTLMKRVPEMEKWIDLFLDWHRGDYDSVEELVKAYSEETKNEHEEMTIYLMLWRILFIQGKMKELLQSIRMMKPQLSDQRHPEIDLLEGIAIGRLGGQGAARGSFIGFFEREWEFYASRYGEFSFDAYLYGELAVLAGHGFFLRRIYHRIWKTEALSPWVEGRAYEWDGNWRKARHAYEQVVENLASYHPSHLVRGEVQERLAWVCFEMEDLTAGLAHMKSFQSFMDMQMLNNEVLKRRYLRLEAKAWFKQGHYTKAVARYRKMLADDRMQGRVEQIDYRVLEKDWITMLLAIGFFSEAKEEIERYPRKTEIERLEQARLELLWAHGVGEHRIYEMRKKELLCALESRDEGKEGGLSAVEIKEIYAVILEASNRDKSVTEEQLNRYRKEILTDQVEDLLEMRLWIAWMSGCILVQVAVPEEIWTKREADLNRLKQPLLLLAEFECLRARLDENPLKRLAGASMILRDHLGPNAMQTMEVEVLRLQASRDRKEKVEGIVRLGAGVREALQERIGILPSERQLFFGREMFNLYEKALILGMEVDDPVATEALVAWTYELKGIHLRIHRAAALRIRGKSRHADLERFALLSQQIVERGNNLEEEGELQQAWIQERDELANALSIYQEQAVLAMQTEKQPILAAGRTYLEMVETAHGFYLWINEGGRWRLQALGDKKQWEKVLRKFRRDLLRNRADFEKLAGSIFQGVDLNKPVRLAPDGLFFSLPLFELARVAGIKDFEVWPCLTFCREKKERFNAYKGMGLFGWKYEEKEDLPWVAHEAEQFWKQGYSVYKAPNKKKDFFQVYEGYFHFSGHGEVKASVNHGLLRNPFIESRLCLPSGEQVTALDLAVMDWSKTQLVYLNACESGSGELAAMQGNLGLSYGLFMGGARSAIVTLYPVSDEVAAQVSVLFYRVIKKVKNRSIALWSVKEALRESASERDLAAFQLLGSGDDLKETLLSRLVRWNRRRKRRENE